jgi:channel protein (hemolysin III family)
MIVGGRRASRSKPPPPEGIGRIHDYIVGEQFGVCQPVSSLSHLLAAIVALLAAVPLGRLARGSRSRMLSIGVYVTTVVVTLSVSGAYHWIARDCPARLVMQRLDHCAIWLLIAGTFTAVHGVMFRGVWRSGILVFIWSYAIMGVTLQCLDVVGFSSIAGLLLYLAMGWVGALSIYKLGRLVGFRAVRFVWLAGLAYSVGAVLEATGRPVLTNHWVGPHEIFHAAVIVGVGLHWAFIRRMLMDHLPRGPLPMTVGVAAAGVD